MKKKTRNVSKNFNCDQAPTKKRIYSSLLDSLFLMVLSFCCIISGNEIFKNTSSYKNRYDVLESHRIECYKIEEEAHIYSFSENESKDYIKPDDMNKVFARYAYAHILLSYDKDPLTFVKFNINVEDLEGFSQERASFSVDQLAYFYMYYCPEYNTYNGKTNDIVNFDGMEPKYYFIKTLKDNEVGNIFLYDSEDEFPYLKSEIACNVYRYLFNNEENLENGLTSYNYLIQTFKTVWEKQSAQLTASSRFLDNYKIYRENYQSLSYSISAISVSCYILAYLLILMLPSLILKGKTLGMWIFKLDIIDDEGYTLSIPQNIIRNLISLILFYPSMVITMFLAGGNNSGWMYPLFTIGTTSVSMFNISAIMFILPIINLIFIITRHDKKSINDLLTSTHVVDTKLRNLGIVNDKKVNDYKEDIKNNSVASDTILDSSTFKNEER